jgi:hypothetical protein
MPQNKLDIEPPVEEPLVEQPVVEVDPAWAELTTFAKAKPRLDNLIGKFSEIRTNIKRLRKERYVDLDVEELRETGEIENDETFIPNRVIDNNIMREKPDAVSFLNGSHRLAVFRCTSNPLKKTRKLEYEFTKGLTFSGWYRSFDRTFDGAILHGWDGIEVVFDSTKPLHVGFEHIGCDKLWFNSEVSDIQESEYVGREYRVTPNRLENFVKNNGFDPVQVGLILESYKDAKRDTIICIHKVYFKYNNCVYVMWYANEGAAKDWLKAPDKLVMGISEQQEVMVEAPQPVVDPFSGIAVGQEMVPTPEMQWVDKEIDLYPIFIYIYKDDENEILVEHKGLGFLHGPIQEANTAIITGFVNGVVRSSNIYASVEGSTTDSPADVRQLDVQLEHGNIYSHELNFFHTPMPDVMVLQAMNYLDTKSASDTGKQSFAVMNRKDSRKTAKEMELAEGAEQQITGATMATLSEFLREVFTFSWQIVQSQAQQDLIDFLLVPQPSIVGAPSFVNDIETISEVYDIRPAGDDDVIKAEQETIKMMQDWPVIQTTPLKDVFLQDMISLRYPEKADIYVPILQAADPSKLVQSLLILVDQFASPAELSALDPMALQQLMQIKQSAMQYIGASNAAQQTIQSGGGQNQGQTPAGPTAGSSKGSGQTAEKDMAA